MTASLTSRRSYGYRQKAFGQQAKTSKKVLVIISQLAYDAESVMCHLLYHCHSFLCTILLVVSGIRDATLFNTTLIAAQGTFSNAHDTCNLVRGKLHVMQYF